MQSFGESALEGRQIVAGGEPRSGAAPGKEDTGMSPGRGERGDARWAQKSSHSFAPAGARHRGGPDPGQRRCAARPGLLSYGPCRGLDEPDASLWEAS